jgi:hypothetical protein
MVYQGQDYGSAHRCQDQRECLGISDLVAKVHIIAIDQKDQQDVEIETKQRLAADDFEGPIQDGQGPAQGKANREQEEGATKGEGDKLNVRRMLAVV